MATKVSIDEYVTEALGVSVRVSDDRIMSGMEDVVRKIELFQPPLMELFNTEGSAVSAIPVTLHAPSLGVTVFKDNDIAIRRPNRAHVKNKLSLLYDRGETAYYYIVGDKLFIEPFKPSRYTYKVVGVAYSVSNGALTWPRRLSYPLALYCTFMEAYKEYMVAVKAIESDIASLPLSAIDSADMSRVVARLASDDAELAVAEISKIKTKLDAVALQANIEGLRVQRIQTRVEYATGMLHRHLTSKAAYNEYFGISQEEKR